MCGLRILRNKFFLKKLLKIIVCSVQATDYYITVEIINFTVNLKNWIVKELEENFSGERCNFGKLQGIPAMVIQPIRR